MKQLIQDARTGNVTVAEVPVPHMERNSVLVRVAASVVSAGTERAVTEFANKSLMGKAQARPDLVRQVMEKVRRDGLLPTLHSVRGRLDQPLSLGYSCAGTVLAVGDHVVGIQPGDRVACAGANYAVHAEVVSVPRLLVARLSEDAREVSLEAAAFATLGAVTLHGIRLAEVRLGDVVAVIGLGLLGQLAVPMLKANGCTVIGLDLQEERAALARHMGADAVCTTVSEFAALCAEHSRGQGADAVLITAETASSDLVQLAAEVARDRGFVISVGTVGLNLQRDSYFKKELTFRVSRSYGPGRYDSEFEEKGRDYPIGYVRWTETRNMEAFLDLLSAGKINVDPLITHRFAIEQAPDAYALITGKTGQPFLGVVLTYPGATDLTAKSNLARRVNMLPAIPAAGQAANHVSVGFLGAGGFALTTLLPAMKRVPGMEYAGVCTASGHKARHAAEKFGFRYCTSDQNELLQDPTINTIAIATRHSSHASQVVAALKAGKNVFCEKPLCLTEVELMDTIFQLLSHPTRLRMMVGFNRRFAPMSVKLKQFAGSNAGPCYVHYRVNAGYLPPNHWTQDPEQGGRLLGEVCHFLDYLVFLAGEPVEVEASALADHGRFGDDNVIITISFANGSKGVVSYMADGDRAYGKERVEFIGGGKVGVLDDFRTLELATGGKMKRDRAWLGQDKGHRGEWEAFNAAIRDGLADPIPLDEIIASTLLSQRALVALRTGERVKVDIAEFKRAIAARG